MHSMALAKSDQELDTDKVDKEIIKLANKFDHDWQALLFKEIYQLFTKDNDKLYELKTKLKGEKRWYKAYEFDVQLLSELDKGVEYREMLEKEPELTIEAIELALTKVVEYEKLLTYKPIIKVSLEGLPAIQKINDLGAAFLGKLISVEGFVKSKTGLLTAQVQVTYKCGTCQTESTVKRKKDRKIYKPGLCFVCNSIRNKAGTQQQGFISSSFNVIEEKQIDLVYMVVEDIEQIDEEKRVIKLVNEWGVGSPEVDSKIGIGMRAKITGILRSEMDTKKGTGIYYIQTIGIELLEEKYKQIMLTDADKLELRQLANQGSLVDYWAEKIFRQIHGYPELKKILICQMIGNPRVRKGVKSTRGDLNVMLIGDAACMAGEHRILLANGSMVRLKELLPDKQGEYSLDLEVYSQGRIVKVDKGFVYENQETKQIKLSNGMEIMVTLNHPLYVKDKGWTRADALKIGDKLIKDDTQVFGKCNISVEKARLLGFLIAEGWRESNGNYKRIGVGVPIGERWILEKLIDDIKKVYNKEVHIAEVKRIPPTKNQVWLRFKSDELYAYLPRQLVRDIPEEIMNAPKEVVSEFLKWLFEGDGHVSIVFDNRHGYHSACPRISYSSISKNMCESIILLLLRFGIDGKLYLKHPANGTEHDSYVISILKYENVEKFKHEIGFASERKKRRLEFVHKHKCKNEDYLIVKQIGDGPSQTVYDIRVPETHSFWADGLHSHNTGKSTFLNIVHQVALKSVKTSGGGTSAVGVTANVRRDELLGAWVLEGGAFVIAHTGIFICDEFEKINKDDRAKLHDGLESQEIHIHKANIHRTLIAETSTLVAANPRKGRFEPYNDEGIYAQFDIPDTLYTRFDFIQLFIDEADKIKDEAISDKVGESFDLTQTDANINEQDKTLFKKYLIYAKEQKTKYVYADVKHLLTKRYVDLRQDKMTKAISVPIGARQQEGIIRIAIIHGKAELKEKVDIADIEFAIGSSDKYLSQISKGVLVEGIDIDGFETAGKTTFRASKLNEAILVFVKSQGIATSKEIVDMFKDKTKEEDIMKLVYKMNFDGDLLMAVGIRDTWRVK